MSKESAGPFTHPPLGDVRKDALGQAIYYHACVMKPSYSMCAAKDRPSDGADAVIATAEAFYAFLTQEKSA